MVGICLSPEICMNAYIFPHSFKYANLAGIRKSLQFLYPAYILTAGVRHLFDVCHKMNLWFKLYVWNVLQLDIHKNNLGLNS